MIRLFMFLAVLGFASSTANHAIGIKRAAVRPEPSVLKKPTKFLEYGTLVTVEDENERATVCQNSKLACFCSCEYIHYRKSIFTLIRDFVWEYARKHLLAWNNKSVFSVLP